MEGREGKMGGGLRCMEGRVQQGQKLGIGGSGSGGAAWDAKSWQAHFEKADFACVE